MLTREDSGATAVLRMAHGKVSALDVEVCEALVAALAEVASGSSTALVVTGTGPAFSAGVDLFRVLDGGAAYLARFLPAMVTLFRALLAFPKPAVAAVNGHAIAGGCIIAAACDQRLMARGSSRIGVPELSVGVPFPSLPFEIVGARVPPARFRELVYSGRLVEADEAVGLGLIDEVVDAGSLMPLAIAAAERLARIPPVTFALTKRSFTAPLLARVEAQSSLEADVREAWQSAAVQRRMREYVEQTVRRSK